MSEWVKGYRSAMAKAFIRLGNPHKEIYSQFSSPEDYVLGGEVEDHLKQDREWTIADDPTEAEWYAWAGTFASRSESSRTGIAAEVSCSCGRFTKIKFVIEGGSISDLLIELLKED